MGSDRTGVLDQRTRRLICEACETEPATVPQIVARMRQRGWKGSTGSMWSTMDTLVQKGYLRRAGTLSQGKRKPSPLYQLVPARRDELHAAVMRNAVRHVEPGSELVIIPAGAVGRAVAALRASGSEVTWAMRTGDSSIGLIVVLDPRVAAGARDELFSALQPAAVERVAVSHVLDRTQLDAYCDMLLEGGALPTSTAPT